MAMGQGTKTTLAQVCADQLGVSMGDIDVVPGDTGYVSLGLGGFASRQAVTAGSSVHLAAKAVRQKALKVASRMLEVDEDDLEITDGNVHLAGAKDVSVGLGSIARALRGVPGYSLPSDVEAGLEASAAFRTDSLAYAHSFHVCEVEVDVATGQVTILRYVALQDSGRLINPLIVEGQVHGGVVHGVGNALFEFVGYDETGQPNTTTFADYLIPTAAELPNIEVMFRESLSPLNPLGVKGVGEGGTVPVAAAIVSAVEDALRPFGVRITRAPIIPMHIAELLQHCAKLGLT
jgi:carbon-monoxide dehydrogenase large subunit